MPVISLTFWERKVFLTYCTDWYSFWCYLIRETQDKIDMMWEDPWAMEEWEDWVEHEGVRIGVFYD